ncbi:MAG: CDC27 family protein [Deltaproteobacteria bacterium]|nr:CDC27 family protein [Deltaproteobacteria bacterium]
MMKNGPQAFLLALLFLGAEPALAATDAASSARAHMRRATEHYNAKSYEAALEELRAADALVSLPIVKFNIARCLEELGRVPEAIAAYERYLLSDDRTAGADKRIKTARSSVAALEASLGTLEVTCSERGASVVIEPLTRPEPCPVRKKRVQPGEYLVKVSAPGCVPFSAMVAVAAGATVSIPVQLIQLAGVTGTSATPKPSAAERREHPISATAALRSEGHEVRKTAGVALIAVGGAGLVGAAVFAGLGAGVNAKIAQANSFATRAEMENAQRTAVSVYNPAAWTCLAGGAAVLATGLALRFWPSSDVPPVAVAPHDGGASVVFAGHFP